MQRMLVSHLLINPKYAQNKLSDKDMRKELKNKRDAWEAMTRRSQNIDDDMIKNAKIADVKKELAWYESDDAYVSMAPYLIDAVKRLTKGPIKGGAPDAGMATFELLKSKINGQLSEIVSLKILEILPLTKETKKSGTLQIKRLLILLSNTEHEFKTLQGKFVGSVLNESHVPEVRAFCIDAFKFMKTMQDGLCGYNKLIEQFDVVKRTILLCLIYLKNIGQNGSGLCGSKIAEPEDIDDDDNIEELLKSYVQKVWTKEEEAELMAELEIASNAPTPTVKKGGRKRK